MASTGFLSGIEAWVGEHLGDAPSLVGSIALGAVVWLVAFGLSVGGLRLLRRVARRTRTQLDDELLARMRFPARWLPPLLGLHAAGAAWGAPWLVGVVEVFEGLVVTYAAVAAFEILVVESWLEKRQGVHVPPLVRQVVIGVVYGCVLLGVAGNVFDIDITPILATGSVTTVVVGLALQAPLSNLFSGLVLHLERSPAVGDWILIDQREGQILEIGWRSTRLRMFSDDVLVVPNAAIVNAQFVNFTQPTATCARNIPVPVPLDIAPHVFDAWCREALAPIEGVLAEPAPRVWLVAIDDHCQRYIVKFWLVEFRRHDDIESEFLKAIWYRFQKAGVAFPVPHQAVRVVTERAPAAFAGLEAARSPQTPAKPAAG